MRGVLLKAFYPCEKVRDFMYDHLEGSLPNLVSMRFQAHLALCPDCSRYLLLYKAAANAKDFRKANPPPEECLDATLDFLKKEGIVAPDETAT